MESQCCEIAFSSPVPKISEFDPELPLPPFPISRPVPATVGTQIARILSQVINPNPREYSRAVLLHFTSVSFPYVCTYRDCNCFRRCFYLCDCSCWPRDPCASCWSCGSCGPCGSQAAAPVAPPKTPSAGISSPVEDPFLTLLEGVPRFHKKRSVKAGPAACAVGGPVPMEIVDIDAEEPAKNAVPVPPPVATTDVPSVEARNLAGFPDKDDGLVVLPDDSSSVVNDGAEGDAEALPEDAPAEEDLDLFAPKSLASVPAHLIEAVKAGREAVQHEPLPHASLLALCKLYPSLPFDLRLPLRQPEAAAIDAAALRGSPLGSPDVEKILVAIEGQAVLLRRVLVSALGQMLAPEADPERVGRALRHASQLSEYLLSSVERTRKQRLTPFLRPSMMLAAARGCTDAGDMFTREEALALEKSVSGAQATRTAPTLAQATRQSAKDSSSTAPASARPGMHRQRPNKFARFGKRNPTKPIPPPVVSKKPKEKYAGCEELGSGHFSLAGRVSG
ncbi:hypothetical protein PAPYR_10912 [Paratrimastix pyriformis]|uniref:Uncharacterized protein n=1 Tax=Paratrimastix pyriformis TaxID=342808 RepID=A0ABQ8U6S2_9EUKA|nr:hypothetical protein PAPYR_10912 [Paratrimastix pyriformis]